MYLKISEVGCDQNVIKLIQTLLIFFGFAYPKMPPCAPWKYVVYEWPLKMHCSTTSRSCRMLYVNKQKMPLALCTEKKPWEKKSFYPSFFFFPPENWRHWIWECWSPFVPWSVLFYCRRCKKIQSRWLRKRSCHYSTWTLCSHHCACCLWFYR